MEEEKKSWIEEMILFESTPRELRKETVGEFCKRHNIPESNYRYHRSKKQNKKRIVELWLSEAFVDGNEVLSKLGEKAKAGDNKSIEMYLKFVLELAENLDIKSDGKPIVQLVNSIAKKHAIDGEKLQGE